MGYHPCLVPSCTHYKEEKLFSFFNLPPDVDSCKAWCQLLGIPEGTSEGLVCHSHFDPSQYTISRRPIPNATPRMIVAGQTDPGIVSERQDANLSPIPVYTEKRMRDLETDVQNRLKRKAEEMNTKDTQIKRLRVSRQRLEDRLELNEITPESIDRHFTDSPTLAKIVKMQFLRFGSDKKSKYDDVEKTLAITLFYSCGRNGYRTLKNLGFRIPALSTIRGWICKLKFLPGRNPEIISCLQDKMEGLTVKERDCVISFDETSIKKFLAYNKSTDAIDGFHNHGNGTIHMRPANHALVFVVRGLNKQWRVPLSFHFSSSSTTTADLKKILFETLADVTAAGANVRAVVTDLGGTNSGLVKTLNISVKKPYFMFQNKKIYYIFDPPHLLKSIRNIFKNHDFKITVDDEERYVKWAYLTEFFDKDQAATLQACPKLTDRHFSLNHFDKMNVRLAAQVLSHSVSAGMLTMVQNKSMPDDAKDTANFIGRMDEIFDMLNISSAVDLNKPIKSGRSILTNKEKLVEHMFWIDQIKTADRAYTPSLKGLQLTLNSVYLLLKDLEAENYGYVCTRRLQSDCVEHLFSTIKFRAQGSPTCQQFRWNFRYIFLTYLLKSPEGSNCEEYEDDDLISEHVRKIAFVLRQTHKRATATKQPESDDSDSEFESDGVDSNDEDRESYELNEYFKSVSYLEYNATSEDDKHCFEKRLDLSYGQLVKEDVKKVFKTIAENFGEKCYQSMNMYGTGVIANLSRQLRTISPIREFCEDPALDSKCHDHRKEILHLFLRARLHKLMQTMNDEINPRKFN